MKKLFFLFCFALCACTANATGTIRVYDNDIYQNVKPMLLADFTKHGILTEDLPTFNPINLFTKEWGFLTGKELFKRLSLSFQYPSTEESKEWTFENIRADYTKVTMYSHGFVLEQGLEQITVSLLGDLDWNKDGVLDWLVYCRIEQLRTQNDITKNDARKAREYLVVVTDRNAQYWQAEPVVIRDITLYTTGQESKIYRNLTMQKRKALEQSLAVDFEAGQTQILDAPGEGEKTKEKTLDEQSLSE